MKTKIKARLEELRNELRAECISYAEIAELQSLAVHIEPGDLELLEAAGVPEFSGEKLNCKKCNAKVDELEVFPGGICLKCHEEKFNAELRKNGGTLPRPDFTKVFSKGVMP